MNEILNAAGSTIIATAPIWAAGIYVALTQRKGHLR